MQALQAQVVGPAAAAVEAAQIRGLLLRPRHPRVEPKCAGPERAKDLDGQVTTLLPSFLCCFSSVHCNAGFWGVECMGKQGIATGDPGTNSGSGATRPISQGVGVELRPLTQATGQAERAAESGGFFG